MMAHRSADIDHLRYVQDLSVQFAILKVFEDQGDNMVHVPEILGVIRPSFLLLTPICVFLGVAVAIGEGLPVDWLAFAIVLCGALSAHVSVNALNEYEDFRSGLDLRTDRTPFSGGSGTLVANPDLVETARTIGLFALCLTAVCGLYLVWRVGWGLVPIGIFGLALVYFYTSKINHHRWMCLIAPGFGFGPLMVLGTHYAATSTWSWSAAVVSLVTFFLVNNLLLLNQFPDIRADMSVGRDNLPIAFGMKRSFRVYGLFVVLAYLVLGLGVGLGLLPSGVVIALATLPLAVLVFRRVNRAIRCGEPVVADMVQPMGLNVAFTLMTPVLLSAGLLVGM